MSYAVSFFSHRWRKKKDKSVIISPDRLKEILQQLPPVSAEGMLYPLSSTVESLQSFDNTQIQQGNAPMPGQSFDNTQMQQGNVPMPGQSFDNTQMQEGNTPMPGQSFDNTQMQQGNTPMPGQSFDNMQMQQGNTPMPGQSFDNTQMQQGNVPMQGQSFDNMQMQQDNTQQNLQGSFAQNTKRVNALSLSSIRKKRELESSLEKNVVDPEDLPRLLFSFEQMMDEWQSYMQKLSRTGYMLMSSLMGMTQPRLEKHLIYLELPNQGSKLSFDENKYELVNHLRKKLSNYDIEIIIEVNEEIKLVKKVFDNKDKLEHFIKLNDNVRLLKETFDLEF